VPPPRGAPTDQPGPFARLLETRDALPGHLLQVWHAPQIASRVRPGQYVLAGRPGVAEVLRAVLPVAGWDRARGTIDLQVSTSRQAPSSRLADLGPGAPADLAGPLGQGFDLDPRSHHLVAVGDTAGMAVLRGLALEAVAGGRQVLVLAAATTVAQVYPSSLLPDEVEYAVATQDGSLGHPGHVVDLLAGFEAWADRCYAAAAPDLLADLRQRA
jgi:NAD(P)H-flavin reductase